MYGLGLSIAPVGNLRDIAAVPPGFRAYTDPTAGTTTWYFNVPVASSGLNELWDYDPVTNRVRGHDEDTGGYVPLTDKRIPPEVSAFLSSHLPSGTPSAPTGPAPTMSKTGGASRPVTSTDQGGGSAPVAAASVAGNLRTYLVAGAALYAVAWLFTHRRR